MEELIRSGIEQGLGYALFIFLLLYVLKTTGDREKKYQETIDKYQETINKLAEQTSINKEIKNDVEEIIKDVSEIKNKLNK